jgi:hypothetical protein
VTPTELSALSTSAEKELKGDILPFWMKYTRNPENGGYYGLITADMTIEKGAPRGALLTSRILWTFSKAYRTYHDPAYLEMATWAYHDLVDHFLDPESGGLFWTITEDGKPLQSFKQIYGQVFGIYALAEYNMATGDKAALEQAIAIYRLVELNARDRVNGGYYRCPKPPVEAPRGREEPPRRRAQVPELAHPHPRGLHEPAAGLARSRPPGQPARADRDDDQAHHRPQDPPPDPLHEGRLDARLR